jgi:hypothetical protein
VSRRDKVGQSFSAEELKALNQVLRAAELGKDVRVVIRSESYLKAAGKLIRAEASANILPGLRSRKKAVTP